MQKSHHNNRLLIEKYDLPVPRYTSYPTVPYWQETAPSQSVWLQSVNQRILSDDNISLYIHLPFCEQLCTYCGCNKRITSNHAVERPYIQAILAEWKIYIASMPKRPKIKELHLGGGTPTFFAPEELAYLIDDIFQYADRAATYSYSFEAHPESTTQAHLDILAARGFDRISIGIQDFNPSILQLINRKQSYESVLATVDGARKAGYNSINFDLIYGLPTQNKIDIVHSAEQIAKFKPERIAFYSYAHVPWVSPGQRAYDEADLPKGGEKRSLYELGKMLLLELGYHEIGLDHFALPYDELYKASQAGRLYRNFMGYTALPTRLNIALGCSSIGDSWNMYVQNEKKVETYQQIVLEKNRLPIVKGHALKTEDQIVRQHILNIMCQQKSSWDTTELQCSALERSLPLWQEMENDGLLKLGNSKLEVLPVGMPFLRNICLPLDDYYWHQQPQQATFSQSV